ncbi:unnamed protein product [Sphagnum jensenii]|uniref:CrcB-like protein n=2 Tax=Sphagnum jensenii TaxID=128206 RepID=A0ABP0V9V9_9BRYO
MQGGSTSAAGGGGTAAAAADDDDVTNNKQGITLDERSASSRHDRASRSLSLGERRESNRLGERQGSSSLGASGGGGVGRLASSLSSNPTPAVLVRDGSRRSLPSPAVVPFRFEISTGSGSSSASDHSGEEDFTRSLSQRGVPLSAPLAPPAETTSGKLSIYLEYVSALAHLATFGIFGVFLRYGLERLIGIHLADSNNGPLFIDLPANMVGSFFMGWVGVVFKKDIATFSELLAIGLSTGLMGSITTYAGWSQQMVVIITKGYWLRALFGLLLGLEIAQMSLVLGIDSAKLLNWSIARIQQGRANRGLDTLQWASPDNLWRRKFGLVFFLCVSSSLWVSAIVLTIIDTTSIVRRRLWLACVVAPPGVWARWLLARLNGQGIGSKHYFKWIPLGTLLTNMIACTLEAILTVIQIAVQQTDAALLVQGLQLGLLGCMSTVSTFVAELYLLHLIANKRWRAYAYAFIMLICCFAVGVIAYTIPVLTRYSSQG